MDLESPIILPYTTEPFEPSQAFPEQTSITRPTVLTSLSFQGKELPFDFPSIIDSGADSSIFPAQFGEALGIQVRDGKKQDTNGIGSDIAYFHDITVNVEIAGNEYKFACWAGFMYSLDRLGKGLLGRHGFFALFDAIVFRPQSHYVELFPRVPSAQQQKLEKLNQQP